MHIERVVNKVVVVESKITVQYDSTVKITEFGMSQLRHKTFSAAIKVVVENKIIVQHASTVKITEFGVSQLITARDFMRGEQSCC